MKGIRNQQNFYKKIRKPSGPPRREPEEGADAAYQAALGEQDKAQEARRDAQAAQVAAETAKDGAVSAMNTAAENSDQTEQLYATFLQQYESIDQRLTALEQQLP